MSAPYIVRSRAAVCASLIATTLLIAGCDTEKGASPQGQGAAGTQAGAQQAAQSGAQSGGQSGGASQRYAIDRSHAGSAMPAATLSDPAGAPARLTTLAGKPLLLNLWATWCAPCVEELPTLDRVAAANDGRANVIALSQDLGDVALPRDFLNGHGWTQIAPWHDAENAVGLAYGGTLPVTVLFDAAGKETARVIGPLDWTGVEARALLIEAGLLPAAAPAAPAR